LIGCGAQRINVNNEFYRQKGSSDAMLGSYGKILKDDSYECDGFITNKIKTVIRAQEEYTLTNKSDNSVAAPINIKKLQIKTDLSSAAIEKDEQSYVAIVIAPENPDELQRILLNKIINDSDLFEKAKNLNFRFISEEVSSLRYSTVKALTHDDNASIEFNVVDKIAIKSYSSKQENIKLANKTIIGYEFKKLCWKDARVIDTVVDLPNAVQSCPKNSSDVYPG